MTADGGVTGSGIDKFAQEIVKRCGDQDRLLAQPQPDLLVDFTPSATVAVERFWALMDRWRDSVEAMTPEQLDTPGFGQYPWGSDPDVPFIVVIWGANIEFIHHMAEVALLRDLWRARSMGSRGQASGRPLSPGRGRAG